MADLGAGVHPAPYARAQHRPAKLREVARQPKRRALLVEDDVMIAMAMEFFLHEEGWDVIGPFQFGEQAVEAARAHRPDAILMDIRLKGSISGLEAAETIRSLLRTPIIFCTAHADAMTVARVERLGEASLLVKPTAPDVLRRALLAVPAVSEAATASEQ